MRNWLFKCFFILTSLFIFTPKEAYAKQISHIYGFKDAVSIEELLKELDKTSIQYKYIEEINVLSTEEELDYQLLRQYDSYIEWDGPEPEVQKNFNSVNKDLDVKVPLMLQKPWLKFDTSYHKLKANTFSLQQVNMDANYNLWRWDINRVTNDGESYKIQKGNHDVKVGIVDSGIDFNHPDLAPNIISEGKSFVPGVTSTQDVLGHGTMVAGVIAANGNLQGISPNIGIVPYKVFHNGDANSLWIIEAITEAAKDDMDVINLSLGTYKSLKNKDDKAIIKAYQRAAKYAQKKGSVLVASSGTDGYDMTSPKKLAIQLGLPNDVQVHLPGNELSEAITVSAVNNLDQLAFYSNYGNKVNISAPAGDYGPDFEEKEMIDIESMTITTHPLNIPQSELSNYVGFDHGYEFMVGTSLAAPKVSATAALIIAEYQDEYHKKPTPKQVERYLYKNASKVNAPKKEVGVGVVDAYESLKSVKGGK